MPGEGGVPVFDREKYVHCGACIWNCAQPLPDNPERTNIAFRAGVGGASPLFHKKEKVSVPAIVENDYPFRRLAIMCCEVEGAVNNIVPSNQHGSSFAALTAESHESSTVSM